MAGLRLYSAIACLFLLCAVSAAVRVRINDDKFKTETPFTFYPRQSNDSDLAKQILAIMNTSVDPCQDFFEYSCGTWIHTYPLPPDASRFGMAFDQIAEDNKEILRGILENPEGEWPLIGPFYRSCMDMATRNALGATPAESILENISKVGSVGDLMAAVGYLHSIGLNTLFAPGVGVDALNPKNNILILSQGGLSLDVPSDYADHNLTTQFLQYVQQVFILAGEDPFTAKVSAFQVLNTEIALAEISLSPAALRDPYATYNNLSLSQLYALTPNINEDAWGAYFTNAGLDIDASNLSYVVDIMTPTFFGNLSSLMQSSDFSTWTTYLQWAVLNQLAPSLSQDFVDANFDFFGKTYSGKKQNTPLWKRCVAQTDQSLGELLGRYYVLEDFPASSKKMAHGLVVDIENAFLANLPGVDWMDNTTRQLAAQKLSMVDNLIGYPDHWKDYSPLTITPKFFMDNVIICNRFSISDQFGQLHLPVDKGRWQMTPPTVNAYYDPTLNEMVFPAGILQSPWFFNETYPPQINYAGIGSVVGHELTHGFDDQGANYDGTGKLHQWWPASVKKQFEERTQCVSDLYSTYEVLPGLYVNGNLTLGENVADIGGVHEAFIAYQTHNKTLPAPPPVIIPGMTDAQMFFIAYGLHWCEVDTPEALRRQVNSNPHSPARFRVNGPLSQLPAFSQAFQCPVGSPMNPSKRCNIW